MSSEPMQVYPEVWPVAADSVGIWLVSGSDAWRPRLPVMADTEPHAEVEAVLSDHEVRTDAAVLHSTSWRVEGPHLILTYLVVLDRPGHIIDHWPDALPISANMANAVGKPYTHAGDMPPTPRHVDVLMHAIRHLSFLNGPTGDGTVRSLLGGAWTQHLAAFTPTFAGMYDQIHNEAA